MIVVCLSLLAVGVVVSVCNPHRVALLTAGAVGMATIMSVVMLVPGVSHFAGAALTMALALFVGAGSSLGRVLGQAAVLHDAARWRRYAVALTLVDLVFMSIAMLLVPEHAATPLDAGAAGVIGHGAAHTALAGAGLMVWFTLLAWGACATVLIMAKEHRLSPGAGFHVVCSGSMIAAMAVMAL